MPPNMPEPQRMLDLFTSVGTRSFVITKTELEWPDHKKVKWGKPYSAANNITGGREKEIGQDGLSDASLKVERASAREIGGKRT
jgi:hypothetical protein